MHGVCLARRSERGSDRCRGVDAAHGAPHSAAEVTVGGVYSAVMDSQIPVVSIGRGLCAGWAFGVGAAPPAEWVQSPVGWVEVGVEVGKRSGRVDVGVKIYDVTVASAQSSVSETSERAQLKPASPRVSRHVR